MTVFYCEFFYPSMLVQHWQCACDPCYAEKLSPGQSDRPDSLTFAPLS